MCAGDKVPCAFNQIGFEETAAALPLLGSTLPSPLSEPHSQFTPVGVPASSEQQGMCAGDKVPCAFNQISFEETAAALPLLGSTFPSPLS